MFFYCSKSLISLLISPSLTARLLMCVLVVFKTWLPLTTRSWRVSPEMFCLDTLSDGTSRVHCSVVRKRAMKDTLALLFSESFHFVKNETAEGWAELHQEPANRESDVGNQLTRIDCRQQGQLRLGQVFSGDWRATWKKSSSHTMKLLRRKELSKKNFTWTVIQNYSLPRNC